MTTTSACIMACFCQVDDQLAGLPTPPEAHLWPREVVTVGLLHALNGVGNHAFYRWLTRDYYALVPRLPERTRLFCLFRTHHARTEVFLAAPTVLSVIDTYGIDLPATGSQHLLHRLKRPEDHPVTDAYQAPAPRRVDNLRREQRGQGHSARLGRRTFGLSTWSCTPCPFVGEQRGQRVCEPIGQQERGATGCSHLCHLMDYALSHGEGAIPAIGGWNHGVYPPSHGMIQGALSPVFGGRA